MLKFFIIWMGILICIFMLCLVFNNDVERKEECKNKNGIWFQEQCLKIDGIEIIKVEEKRIKF